MIIGTFLLVVYFKKHEIKNLSHQSDPKSLRRKKCLTTPTPSQFFYREFKAKNVIISQQAVAQFVLPLVFVKISTLPSVWTQL